MLMDTVKKPAIPALIGILAVVIIIPVVSIMIFRAHSDNSLGKAVTDIESVSLRLSGMRLTEEYELTVIGGRTEISYYTMSYANGGEEKILRKRTDCGTQEVIDALNGVDFVKWNGFHGSHPKGVSDGTTFTLTAALNGGQELRASGSQNFPKRFHEFEQWLCGLLRDVPEIG